MKTRRVQGERSADVARMRPYDVLVAEALDAPFLGWDFSWLRGRSHQAEPSWSYDGRVRQLTGGATSLLDLCTGGGELLASLAPTEIARVLRPGGTSLVQGVGAHNLADLNEAETSTLDATSTALQAAGPAIVDGQEEVLEHALHDIGALVYFLNAVTWQVPDFDVHRYDAELRELDAAIRERGPVVFHDHRYLVEARKP
jgi:hypothetical protein